MREIRGLVAAGFLAIAGCGADTTHLSVPTGDDFEGEIVNLEGEEVVFALEAAPPGHIPANAITLTADQIFGAVEDGFGRVKDLASSPGGGLFVADNVVIGVLEFDSDGKLIRTVGRSGDGPGEYRSPTLVARVGEFLVVGQPYSGRALIVFDIESGREVGRVGFDAQNDWGRWRFRHPLMNVDGDQQGSEDAVWRLAAAGDSTVLLKLRPNDAPNSSAASEATYVVSFHLPDGPMDTLAVLGGTAVSDLAAAPGAIPRFTETLYAPRAHVAAGDGWIALSHGDSSHVWFEKNARSGLAKIEWPPRTRSRITDDVKLIGARWQVAVLMANSTYSRDLANSMSRQELREGLDMHAFDLLEFPERGPELTAMAGHGSCLFLAGFQPRDNPYGISLTWTVVDVTAPRIEAVIRLDPPPGSASHLSMQGALPRLFAPPFAYAVYRDDYGISWVARYRLPDLHCAGRD